MTVVLGICVEGSSDPNWLEIKGCNFFAYSWKLPAYSLAYLLTVVSGSFFAYGLSFSTYNSSFFAYN